MAADVIPFLSKEVRERDEMIRKARAVYESIFLSTPVALAKPENDKRLG